jgi:hypothetical protein
LDLFRLNFALLTLIPKEEDAKEMKKFRPISLTNCSFKIFSKVLTLRLGRVCQRIVAMEQTAFIKGRYILESVVVAHELVHSLYKNKEEGIILKLDYEKAYDRVSWDFLFEVLESRGFGKIWIKWIKQIVQGGFVSVVLNGVEGNPFKTGKGLRQGDPISPLLFNLVADTLTRMLKRAADKGLVRGLLSSVREGGIMSLQYVDDTLLFSSVENAHLRNLKCILLWFEQVSGMRINFHKSEIVPFNLDERRIHMISLLFGCPIGSLPMKYLGVPLHVDRLRREDIQSVVDKIVKKIAGWRGRLLPLVGG